MNVTATIETQSVNDLDLPQKDRSRDLLTAVVLLTNIVSFVANLIVVVAIVIMKKLRKSLSSVYILSLCMLGLVASGTVIPKSVAVVFAANWIWSEHVCIANGLFNAFLTFAVILTVCAIDIEKYYCIKYPMHHAGHMTTTVAIISIVVTWVIALVFAAIPMASWNGYTYRAMSLQCTYLWERRRQNVIYGVVITFFFLCVPLILMLHVNYSMYKIAKRAMRQVKPITTDEHNTKTQVRLSIIVTGTQGECSRMYSDSPEMATSISTALSRNGSRTVGDDTLNTNRASIYSSCIFEKHSEAIKKIQAMHGVSAHSRDTPPPREPLRQASLIHSDTNYKALKTLIIPFVYFLIVWGSYFLVHLTWATGIMSQNATVETYCTLLVYVSYSLNPFVYGFMNKMIRHECIALLQGKLKKSREERRAQSPPPPSCENFLEFLDRTSYSAQGQHVEQTDSSAVQRTFVRTSVIDCHEKLPVVCN